MKISAETLEKLKTTPGYRAPCPDCGANRGLSFWATKGLIFCHACPEGKRVKGKIEISEVAPAVIEEAKKFERRELPFTPIWDNRVKRELAELAPLEAYRDYWRLGGVVGWDDYYGALAVAIKDKNGRVKAVKMRNAETANGDIVKWMSKKGSSNKIAATYFGNVDNPFCFIASGIGEYLLLHASEMNYYCIQSDNDYVDFDAIVKAGLIPILVSDNDKDKDGNKIFFEKFTKKYRNKPFFYLDWEIALSQRLPKGFDLRDFANMQPKDWIFWLNFIALKLYEAGYKCGSNIKEAPKEKLLKKAIYNTYLLAAC